MPALIQPLPDGPLDIIGDVHGEIDALRALLGRLGVDADAATVQRPLVFVGDLVDRGPDSPAVVRLVRRLTEAGVAHAIAGNHEINLLQGQHKEGNGWFFGHNDGYHEEGVHRPFESVEVTDDGERAELRGFLATLPVALERDDLRVVHACWDPEAMTALPHRRDGRDLGDLANTAEDRVRAVLHDEGAVMTAMAERERWAGLTDPDVRPEPPLPGTLRMSLEEQRNNPYRVITSGKEHAIDPDDWFYVGGKWRVVERSRWWEEYAEAPAVIVGHYWRRRAGPIAGKRDLWDHVPPYGWAGPRGNVFCVDYSVGRRFLERWRLEARGRRRPFHFRGGLAALRWPERTLVFDDAEDPVPTTGFGGSPDAGNRPAVET